MRSEISVHSARRQKIWDEYLVDTLDVVWISKMVNIRYLTGFTGTQAHLLLTRKEAIFLTDGRYQEQAGEEVRDCQIKIIQNMGMLDALAEEIRKHKWQRLGFESLHVTYDQHKSIQEKLSQSGKTLTLVPLKGVVEQCRMIKDETELKSIRKASQLLDQIINSLLTHIRRGISELEMARILQNLYWEFGATGPSFDPIILFGERTSLPHGKPSHHKLKKNDLVLIDFGCVIEGYCSDCTRTFVYGKPDKLMEERHQWVQAAQAMALSTAGKGVECVRVDAAARDLLNEAGCKEAFMHSTGHGIGLEIHEEPRLSPLSHNRLAAGHVVTIEPGIYFPGWGGIRIEDAIIIKEKGIEVLTHSDRSLQLDV